MASESDLEIETEADLQAFFAGGMRIAGWDVHREHSPDQADVRADLLARRGDIGAVGIETKYVTNSGPRETGAAVRQLLTQYAGHTYDGDAVDIWGVVLYGDGLLTTDTRDYTAESQAYQFACRRLANQLGIGFGIIHRDLVYLDFGVSVPALRVPLFDLSHGDIDDEYVDLDLSRLEDLIDSRFPE